MNRVGAIVLAAGASTRLGRPKQLVTLGTENLLERSIRVAREAPCSPILVVLGAFAELIREQSNLEGAHEVLNLNWQEGMASSIRAGINALPDLDGVILMVCDMPAVTPAHLRALSDSGEVKASLYAGRRGVPAYLPKTTFAVLKKLRGDAGAREVLRNAASIPLPDGNLDIDGEEDFRLALKLTKQNDSIEG